MFVLDPSYRRPGDGRVVVAGSPLKLFRVGSAGVRVLRAIESGEDPPAGHEPLTDRLLAAGAIHPVPDGSEADPDELTVVLPAYRSVPRSLPRRCAAVVVDDASPAPLRAELAPREPLRVVRHDTNRGPAAARNTGLGLVTTPWVAFVDSDVDVDESTLLRLVAFAQRVGAALVAPRVTAPPATEGSGARDRYERSHSPLDLGDAPARIAPGTRVGYVPAAVLVCRADALRDAGGFDEGLRFGEDVDLVWRLVGRGEVCRYEPSCLATHRVRPDARSWLRQRFDYGSSAAPLARRHPGALAPVRMSGWSGGTWALVLAGRTVAGAVVAAGTAVALVRKLPDLPTRESLRLAGLGHLHAGRLLAAAVLRAWWPVALALAVASPRCRMAAGAAAAAVVLGDPAVRAARHDLPAQAVLRVADDVAYGAGVWAGMWRERTLAPIVPELSSWPGRSPNGA